MSPGDAVVIEVGGRIGRWVVTGEPLPERWQVRGTLRLEGKRASLWCDGDGWLLQEAGSERRERVMVD